MIYWIWISLWMKWQKFFLRRIIQFNGAYDNMPNICIPSTGYQRDVLFMGCWNFYFAPLAKSVTGFDNVDALNYISFIFKGCPDSSHFIFEIDVGKKRIRHRTTLNSNDAILSRFWADPKIHYSISESLYVGSDTFWHWFQK